MRGGNDARIVVPVHLMVHMLVMWLSNYAKIGLIVSTEKERYTLELTAMLTNVTRATTFGGALVSLDDEWGKESGRVHKVHNTIVLIAL